MPFAGLCCLGIIGFLIAATIVLALIPIYLPRRNVSPGSAIGGSKIDCLESSAMLGISL
jgi:hypothetical protein